MDNHNSNTYEHHRHHQHHGHYDRRLRLPVDENPSTSVAYRSMKYDHVPSSWKFVEHTTTPSMQRATILQYRRHRAEKLLSQLNTKDENEYVSELDDDGKLLWKMCRGELHGDDGGIASSSSVSVSNVVNNENADISAHDVHVYTETLAALDELEKQRMQHLDELRKRPMFEREGHRKTCDTSNEPPVVWQSIPKVKVATNVPENLNSLYRKHNPDLLKDTPRRDVHSNGVSLLRLQSAQLRRHHQVRPTNVRAKSCKGARSPWRPPSRTCHSPHNETRLCEKRELRKKAHTYGAWYVPAKRWHIFHENIDESTDHQYHRQRYMNSKAKHLKNSIKHLYISKAYKKYVKQFPNYRLPEYLVDVDDEHVNKDAAHA